MDEIKIIFSLLFTLLSLDLTCTSKYTGKLLVVSFDGFRWDYTKFTETPIFDSLEKFGTRVKYMHGVFPTKTFPSHISLATGVHPETHGIVANYMYDRDLDQHFSPRALHDPKWWTGTEPIWKTAKKQGLKTAVSFWLGSEIQGMRPDFLQPFAKNVSFEHRADRVIHWLKHDDVDLAMLYFDEPDTTAHDTGTPLKSRKTTDAIRHCDRKLGYLLTSLRRLNLSETVNVLVVSDHGMTDLRSPDSIINLLDYTSMNDIHKFADEGALANILPKPGREEAVYQSLVGKHPNMTVYRRENMPHHYHYRNHSRIHPILVIADEGWIVARNATEWRSYNLKGVHGYDNRLLTMKSYFRAVGPNIKRNFENPIFSQIDVYSLMCEILGIQPAPNNGSLDAIGQMLVSFEDKRPVASSSDLPVTSSSDFIDVPRSPINYFLVFTTMSLLSQIFLTTNC